MTEAAKGAVEMVYESLAEKDRVLGFGEF